MLHDLDNWYLNQPEPAKSCLMALRALILAEQPQLTEAWKYRMPMFCLNGKMFCYLWKDKDTGQPYIGFVEGRQLDHPLLEKGNRARMKILRIDAEADLPTTLIGELLEQSVAVFEKRK